MSRCPRCDSPQPHLHPAVQHEGEVHPCYDPYHEIVTTSNTPSVIAKHLAFRDRVEASIAWDRADFESRLP